MKIALDPVATLGAGERAAMAALLGRHFEGVSPGQFAADLAGKTHVLRLVDGGTLAGFSTIAYERLDDAGEAIGVIHSGDTIVDPAAWHAAALAPAWVAAVHAIHAGRGPLWWLLICSGVRTWRFLPTCCRDFVPRPGGDPALLARRDRLAARRYGAACAGGIVRLAAPQRLRAGLDEVPAHLAADPLVGHFLALNPGWRAGDELCCLAALDEARLTPLGQRQLRLGRRMLA